MSGPLEIHEIPVRNSGRAAHRAARLHLRQGLRDLTQIRRVRWCGRLSPRWEGAKPNTPEIRKSSDGGAYIAGVATCGSVWACPVCAAKKRTQRALEASRRFQAWERVGGSLALLTLTLPHGVGDRCDDLMRLLKCGWRSVFAGRAYRQDRDDFGVAHWFRGWDATYGRNGWHPHLHAVLLLHRPLSEQEIVSLRQRIGGRWINAIADAGHKAPSLEHGIDITLGASAETLGSYVSKLAPSASPLALEASAPHLKSSGGRGTFDLLSDAIRGDRRALALWREWEVTTQGQHFTQWSRGAKAALDDLENEEGEAPEAGDEVIHQFSADEWFAVRDRPDVLARLLCYAEHGRSGELLALLARVRTRRRPELAA